MRRFAIALAFVIAPLALSQSAPQTPKIRVSTRLVQIGVIVRDKNGPVTNLKQGDFTILDRGKPQKISMFSVESGPTPIPSAAPHMQTASNPTPLPPNAFSDLPQYAAPPRSVTIVLLDNLNTLYGSAPASRYEETPLWVEDLALQNAKNHLVDFIKQLQPEDRVAIYGLTHSLHVVCDFTSDRNQLLAILKNYDTKSVTNRQVVEPGKQIIEFPGHDSRIADISRPSSSFEDGASLRLAAGANESRETETLAALQEIAAHVANIPGRKNLVWLTANLPFSGAEMARILGPANIAVYPVDARGLLGRSVNRELMPGTADADDVSGASGHMDNMPAQSSQPIGIATMQKVADQTGGQAFVNTNDLTGAIRKAVEDSAVTYTLGFYINSDSLDGKFHEIKVEVNRKGLAMRYPKGYFAFPDAQPSANDDERAIVNAMASPIESSTILLNASVNKAPKPRPNSFNLVCSIDIHGIRFTQSGGQREGAVTVYVIGQNAAGKVLHHWSKTYNLQFSDAQYESLLKTGIPFRQGIELSPDVTTLRVLVQDPSTSKLGSLIIPLAQVN